MNRIKVAVIGCGSIAQKRHLAEYAQHSNVEIVAVCDIVADRAQEVAKQHQANPYTNYKKLFEHESVDVVSVCVPNYLHASVSIAALKAGAHVLCEKPMATSLEEAREMIETAKTNNKTLMIAHNQRFVSSHQKAKQLIESGEIGKIYSFRTTFGHGGPEGWSIDGKESWFFKKEEAFIGAMGDLGVHKTDLMRYLLGEEFTEVAGFIEANAKENSTVDDNAVCILKTKSGTVGTLAASWAYAKEDNSTIIYGEHAILRLEDDPDHSLIVQYKNGEVSKFELGKIQSNKADGQRTTHVIDHFLESVQEGRQPLVDGEEGKKSLAVVLGALESMQTKKVITL